MKIKRELNLPLLVLLMAVLFVLCLLIGSISIPAAVDSIKPYTFYGCEALTSVNVPSNIVAIGGSAFYGCTEL